MQIYRITQIRKILRLVLIALMAVNGVKLINSVIQYQGIYYSMLEPYSIFNGRSPHLYTVDEDGHSTFVPAHSVYYFDKYEQPVHLLHHSQEPFKTTAMYQPFRQPIFVNTKLPDLSKMTHPNYSNLSFPLINSPWVNNENTLNAYLHLYHMIKFEEKYPEYLWGHYGECLP